MGRYSRGRPIRVSHEIVRNLPGARKPTMEREPENEGYPVANDIHTGSMDVDALTSPGHRVIGTLFWVGWFSWGVYTWWFVDRTLTDFAIGLAVWTGAFAFTVIGVPIVRRAARNRHRR